MEVLFRSDSDDRSVFSHRVCQTAVDQKSQIIRFFHCYDVIKIVSYLLLEKNIAPLPSLFGGRVPTVHPAWTSSQESGMHSNEQSLVKERLIQQKN